MTTPNDVIKTSYLLSYTEYKCLGLVQCIISPQKTLLVQIILNRQRHYCNLWGRIITSLHCQLRKLALCKPFMIIWTSGDYSSLWGIRTLLWSCVKLHSVSCQGRGCQIYTHISNQLSQDQDPDMLREERREKGV